MRTQIRVTSPEVTLTRLLDALERELLEASDQEILEAAKELGMDPTMKGSAAFLGLKYSYLARLVDFFGDMAIPAEIRAPVPKDVGRLLEKGRAPKKRGRVPKKESKKGRP